MAEYKIRLDIFEGPMALLVNLIEKNKIDIYNIPIAQVTEQYLEYLNTLKAFNIDIASEFLVMAATLLRIKSSLLLPKHTIADDEELLEDPRQDLVERIIEYRKYKQLAGTLSNLLSQREAFVTRMPMTFESESKLPEGLQLEDLLKAMINILNDSEHDYAIVNREEINVKDKMVDIIKLLRMRDGKAEFKDVMISGTRHEVIAVFLALLELIRLRQLTVSQKEIYGPIFLYLRSEKNNVL